MYVHKLYIIKLHPFTCKGVKTPQNPNLQKATRDRAPGFIQLYLVV